MRKSLPRLLILSSLATATGCSGTEDAILSNNGGASPIGGGSGIIPGIGGVGGSQNLGGAVSSGGTNAVATTPGSGGVTAVGTIVPTTGGTVAMGGTKATGGTSTAGGTKATGGTSAAATTAAVACNGPSLSGGTTYTSDGSGSVAGGYHYELWHDGGGSMKMTVYGNGAAFKADWNNAGDFLARVGLKWDSTKTYDKYGTITADFAYKKSGTGGGYSFIGIYGWSKSPLIEYYIVEDWFGSGPPTGGGTQVGSAFELDGGTYKVYKFQRVSKPSIEGTQTFWQYFSVRQTARQCGRISVTEHFNKWKSLGLNLGNMYESKILVEAGGGVGTFDLTTATMTAK